MYRVKPSGINTRHTDRDVFDGFLQECVNLQKRDGSMKPIPNRLLSDINTTLYGKIILHKVADEDQINVLGFSRSQYGFLAEDLSAYLGGGEDTLNGNLTWFGTITNGTYSAKTSPQVLTVIRTAGMSWTNLNGLLYFMGNGLSIEERYYKRLQYNISSELYEEKDMCAWKTLIPYYPTQVNIQMLAPKNTWNLITQCGFVLTRFTLVLKTGEEVLHSPIYFNYLYGFNRSTTQIAGPSITTETTIKNIHTVINLNLEYLNTALFGEEISAINVYTSIPKYEDKIPANSTPTISGVGGDDHYSILFLLNNNDIKGEIQSSAEAPFYLVKTIEKPTADQLILSVGLLDSDVEFKYDVDSSDVTYSKIDILTIAAGQSMPVDNYSYHNKYGELTSHNGRIVIGKPVPFITIVPSVSNFV